MGPSKILAAGCGLVTPSETIYLTMVTSMPKEARKPSSGMTKVCVDRKPGLSPVEAGGTSAASSRRTNGLVTSMLTRYGQRSAWNNALP